jgi:hypothetical protein
MGCPLLGHGFGIASSNGVILASGREYLWRSMKKISFISMAAIQGEIVIDKKRVPQWYP